MCSSVVMAVQQVSTEQAGYWMAFPMSSPPLLDAICSPKAKGGGDLSTSADDAAVKVRKPYTITKQRERWTEEEHQKFLDALKLHGRAWRRIEEHIGTKTAVQIRSHAQKFFSKLEREACLGGPLATPGSGEIEIPPPRPKRKPSHPYPKKACGAFSGSPSFEEDCKSPPAVHSAFTPLESGTGASISKMPSKTFRSSAASLRLFGQNVVPGSDKTDADTELVESTGSPRSQVSVETEDTSGISPLASNTGSGVWDQNAPVSQPQEIVGTLSGTNTQLYQAISEWENSIGTPSKTDCSKESHALSNEGCYILGQPSSLSLGGHPLTQFSASVPTFWQGLVPPGFAHATSEDMNTAAAIAAATYAVASVWQAIQGALANASNEGASANVGSDANTRTVYSPIAMLAAARQPTISRPRSPDSHTHGHGKRKQGHNDAAIRNEDEGNDVCGEESTAECCSGVTDTSRLSSYESNDEGGGAAKKCCRNFHDDDIHLNRHAPESCGISNCDWIAKVEKPSIGSGVSDVSQKNDGVVAICSSSSDDHKDGTSISNKGRIIGGGYVDRLLQPEIDTAKISVLTNGDHPLDLIIHACGLDSPLETNQSFLKEKEACGLDSPLKSNQNSLKEKEASDDSKFFGKEFVLSSEVPHTKANKALIPNQCSSRPLHDRNNLQTGSNATCIEYEHLFMIKAGATLSSRYSGTGFVPYKKSQQEGSR